MNYFEYHIGDYIKSTAHLSMLEDAAYRRLIDAYYTREAPLPLEKAACYRLARAQAKDERKAVDAILDEFFSLYPEGWRQKRCDEEIERYRNKSKKAKESADARWAEKNSERNANAYANAMRTDEERNATCARPSNQKPVTSNQPQSTAAGLLSKAMRENSVESQPGDPRIIALAEQGVTPETVAAACVELKRQKPGERISPGLVASVITRWAKDATKIQGATAPNSKTASALMSLEGMKHEPTGIQYGDGERPSEVAGFIPAKHASG